MGWEQRRGRSYYYRKVREGGRIRSQYMGSGTVAQLSAELDGCERQEREQKRCEQRKMRDEERQIDRQLTDAETKITTITNATLRAAGYHQHKGQWRKRRLE